jgi:hypothetical protein
VSPAFVASLDDDDDDDDDDSHDDAAPPPRPESPLNDDDAGWLDASASGDVSGSDSPGGEEGDESAKRKSARRSLDA